MEIFKRRPFMLCCAVFISVAALSFFVRKEIKLIFMLIAFTVCAVIFILLLCKKLPQKHTVDYAVLLIALFMGATAALESYLYLDVYLEESLEGCDTPMYVEGIVINVESEQIFESSYVISLRKADEEKAYGKAHVTFDSSQELKTGDSIRIYATKVSLKDICESDGELNSLVSDGIRYAFTVSGDQNKKTELIDEGNFTFRIFIGDLKDSLCRKLERSIKGESGKLSSALLLGERYALSNETRTNFSRSGIFHMLALSGLHLTVLTGLVDFILRKARVPKLVMSCIMPFIILAYLTLTGFNLSTVRAGIMLTVVYLTFILAMPSDSLTVLFFTGFSILLFSPASVADVGFWMSFLATFGIVLVSVNAIEKRNERIIRKSDNTGKKLIGKVKRAFGKLGSSLLVTFAANLAVLFLIWVCFGEISLATPVTNILFSPVVILHFILSIATLLFYPIPFLQSIAASAAQFTGKLLISGTAFVSNIENVSLSLEYPFSGYIIIMMTLALAVMLIIKLKHRFLLAIPPIVAAVTYAVCIAISLNLGASSSEITYINSKGNDALIITHNTSAVICDVSNGAYTNINKAWKVAKDNGVTEINTIILTHYHDKHRIALSRLASNAKIRRIALPYPQNSTEYAILSEIYSTASANGIELSVYDYGAELTIFGEGKLTVCEPLYLDRSVQPTFTVEYSFGGQSALYVSSAYPEANEADYLAKLDGKDYVIYGSHGPLPKQPFELPYENTPSVIIFADKELLDLSYARSTVSLFSSELFYDCEYKKLEFKLQE